MRLAELINQQQSGDKSSHLPGLISQVETHVDELNNRKERRLADLKMERNCMIDKDRASWPGMGITASGKDISIGSSSWFAMKRSRRLPLMRRANLRSRKGGLWKALKKRTGDLDLISRKPHPHDDKTFIEVKFIEVKGRATIGEIAVTSNEYKTAERLHKDYWLYVVYNCAAKPEIHTIQRSGSAGLGGSCKG